MMDLWLPPKPAIIRPAEYKQASFIPAWFPAGIVSPKGPAFSILSSGINTANQIEYTFSSLSFGAAATDRLLIVAVTSGGVLDPATLLSATIGGVSATIHAQANNTGNSVNGHAAVFSALVPTGTSGSVVVTWDGAGAMGNTAYALYRATGLVSSTPTDTATAAGTSPTMSIDRANNGFIVAAAAGVNASDFTWPSPMAEDFVSSDNSTRHSLASSPVTSGAVTNFNAAPTSGTAQSPSRYAAASWA